MYVYIYIYTHTHRYMKREKYEKRKPSNLIKAKPSFRLPNIYVLSLRRFWNEVCTALEDVSLITAQNLLDVAYLQ
jgi:hypothetical protein